MTAAKRITVDDLKAKAEDIRDSVQEDARAMLHEEAAKAALVAAAVVVVGLSLAFYLGTRRGRR